MTKPWLPLAQAVQMLRGHLGVFELGDADGKIIFIGFAGGKSRFGLKSEVAASAAGIPGAVQARYEITTAYHTRYRELLMVHKADHGVLPEANPSIKLGTLSPL